MIALAVAGPLLLSGCATAPLVEAQTICKPSLQVPSEPVLRGAAVEVAVDTCGASGSTLILVWPPTPTAKPGHLKGGAAASYPKVSAAPPITAFPIPPNFPVGNATLVLIPSDQKPGCVEGCGYPETSIQVSE